MTEANGHQVESVYMEKRVFEPTEEFVKDALVKSMDEYKALYERSISDPEGFWGEMAAEHLDWFKKWEGPAEEYSFKDDIYLRYFAGGKLNVSYNCLDRHLKTDRKNKAALIFQGEPLEDSRTYTYQELHREVCKCANVLKALGVKKGRSRVDLSSDDTRASHRDACVREDRCDPQRGVRRVQCGCVEGPDPGLQERDGHHVQLRVPFGASASDEEEFRCGPGVVSRCKDVSGGQQGG